jgi:signal transduction histidine kinase
MGQGFGQGARHFHPRSGIAQGDINRLFQRFAQLDSTTTRRAGGTGLGLVISKGIVEQHGGSIWVESQLQQCSTFSFSLPRVRVEPPDAA